MTGLTNQLGLSDMSAISHHDSDGDESEPIEPVDDNNGGESGRRRGRGGEVSSSVERKKMLLEEQQELRVNLMLVSNSEERQRLQERLQWTQQELQSLEK